MKAKQAAFFISLCVIGLAAAYLAANLYFCAASLKGDLGGCGVSAGASLLRSPVVIAALLASFAGLIFAIRRG